MPDTPRHPDARLSPWPVRLLAYAVLVLIALASIWFIDQRAMIIMHEHGWVMWRDGRAAPAHVAE